MRPAALPAATLTALLILAPPASAGIVEDCLQDRDPGLNVSACTAVIDSGQWQGKELAAAYNNRGIAHGILGDSKRAVEDFGQALGLDPDNAHYFLQRGLAYRDLGKNRRALKDFSRTLRLDPDSVVAYINRGLAFRDLDNPNRAVKDFDQVLRLDPDNAPAYNNRAWTLYYWRRYAEALGDAERALALSPGNPAALDTRAHVLATLGRTGEAVAEFERAMQAGGGTFVRMYQQALAKHGHYRGAVDGVYGAPVRAALAACLEAGCRVVE